MRLTIEPNKTHMGRRSKLYPWKATIDQLQTLGHGATKGEARKAAEDALLSAYVVQSMVPVVRVASDGSLFVGVPMSEDEVRISHFGQNKDGTPNDGSACCSYTRCKRGRAALEVEVERMERSYSEAIAPAA